MKFIKNNSYEIVKLMINQVGITIFSLVLYTAVGFVDDDGLSSTIRILLSIFASIFYLSLIYCAAWDFGASDRIKIDGGKIDNNPAKGAFMSLVANLPNFLISGVAVALMAIHIFSGNESAYSAFAVANLLLRFLNAMFLGILQGIFSFLEDNVNAYYLWQSVGYFVLPLVTVLVTHIGYTLGLKEFRIFGFLSSAEKGGKK
nr:hypothetical protein [Oscillospiraceae bacterium]